MVTKVDKKTYAIMYGYAYSACLDRCRGDKKEAKALADHLMRNFTVGRHPGLMARTIEDWINDHHRT